MNLKCINRKVPIKTTIVRGISDDMKNVLSSEFLERYKNGEREFSDINLQYADISGMSFNDIIIKNSRLFFLTFRSCNFENARFVNCEIIYDTFYNGSMKNIIFDKCKIDFGFIENVILNCVKMNKSNISWTAIFSNPIQEIDTSTSVIHRLFTDPVQITPNIMEEAMSQIGPIIDSLDESSLYGIAAQNLANIVINAYNETNMYKQKKGYNENSSSYK